MKIQHRHHHFHFFGNREVASLDFALALVGFGVGLVSVFIPVYLWQIGFPLWQILLFYLLEAFYFIPLGFLMVPLFRRLTDKSMLLLSLPFFILYFLGVSYIEQMPWLFFLMPAVFSIRGLLFNTGYHLDFSAAVDGKNLGKELGARYMISSLFSLVAPFIGGLIIVFLSFQTAFYITAFILLVAILPLLFFPPHHVSPKLTVKSVWGAIVDKRLKYNTLSNIGYANEFIVGGVVWKLFLFLAIGSIEQFGGLVSISLLVSAIVTYFAGMVADGRRKRKELALTSGLLSGLWITRTITTTALGAAISQIVLHLIYPSLIVVWTKEFYHLAKTHPNPTVFILGREILLRISRVAFIGLLILLAVLVSQSAFFAICFVVAGIFSLFFMFSNKQDKKVFEKV